MPTKYTKEEDRNIVAMCDRCGFDMVKLTECHLLCRNCGAEQDCSDKGSIW